MTQRIASSVGRSSLFADIRASAALERSSTLTAYGIDRNRTTVSSYNRQTGEIYIGSYLLVKEILWDIKNADTYDIDFITTLTGSTSEYSVVSGAALSAGADIVVTPTLGDFLLIPGQYYLSIYTSTPRTFDDYNVACAFGAAPQVAYWGTSLDGGSRSNHCLPVKFNAYELKTKNVTRYRKYL